MKSLLEKASDGCHRYGWLINLAVMFVMFAYFVGGLNQTVVDLRGQVTNLNQTVISLTERVTRLEDEVTTMKLEVQMNGGVNDRRR